jgi:hypothetical protein
MLLFRALRLTFFCLSFLNGIPFEYYADNLDWAVFCLAGETYRRSAVLLYASSYVTWTFQTHTFSNSIEAVLVSCSLVTVIIFKHSRVNQWKNDVLIQAMISWSAFSLGILCSLGVFFRITFPAFLFPAMVSCIPDLLRRYYLIPPQLMLQTPKINSTWPIVRPGRLCVDLGRHILLHLRLYIRLSLLSTRDYSLEQFQIQCECSESR